MFVLQPLSRRPIRLLWAAQVLAATGSEFYMVAIVWIAAGLIGREAGYVSALQAGALLAGSLFGGILTDRWRPGTAMIVADLTRATLMLVLSLAGFLGAMSLPLLALTAGCVALATSTFDPALQTTLPVIANEPTLRHATNGLFDATKRMARILGPSLIALVNGILPMGQFFSVTAATFLTSAIAVRAVTGTLALAPRQREEKGAAAVIDSVLGGMRCVRSHAVVIYGMIANLIGNVTWAGGLMLGMVLHLRATSSTPLTDYSLMMFAYGLGNVASNFVLASFRPARPGRWLVSAKLIFGLGVMLLPLAPDRTALMLIAAFAAINGPLENLALLHLMQTRFPPHRLAQVYRLHMCAIFSGLLIGYLLSPSLFGRFGLTPVIMASGALTLATGLVGIALVAWRRAGAVRVKAA